jgi:hypothetical protein
MPLVTLLDASSQPHLVAWHGQDTINDASGSLEAGAVGDNSTPQQIAAASSQRAGFLFQNTSQSAMWLYESGVDAAPFYVPAFGYFPPNGTFPIPTGAILVAGSENSEQGDTFTYREWVNAPSQNDCP